MITGEISGKSAKRFGSYGFFKVGCWKKSIFQFRCLSTLRIAIDWRSAEARAQCDREEEAEMKWLGNFQLVERLLGGRREEAIIPDEHEEVSMDDYEIKARSSCRDSDDEDDRRHPGEGVQCAQQ